MSFSIIDIKKLFNRAKGHSVYFDKLDNEDRKIEAFFLQSALLEGVLCQLAFETMGKSYPCIYGKRSSKYGLSSAIDDLYLLKVINDEEFKILEKFKSARNKYFHTLLSQNINTFKIELGENYNNFEEITWIMIEKLEKLKT